MYRKLVLSLCLVLFSATMVVAQNNATNGSAAPDATNGSAAPAATDPSGGSNGSGDSDAKMISGMSILGNKEAPMSLFIVPWKSSELGAETSLNRTLDERDVAVDRDVFMRELDFYQVSVGSKTSTPAAVSQVLNSR
jgi:hypothetical protein